MIIQFIADRTVGDTRSQRIRLTTLLTDKLKDYRFHVFKLDVHLKNENGKNEGPENMLCMLETQLNQGQFIAVTRQSDTLENAVLGAADRLRKILEMIAEEAKNPEPVSEK